MNRQIRRLEKAVDELIKIQDDGKGTSTIINILDMLNSQITQFESESE